MNLSPQLTQAAQDLGAALRQSECVQEYQQAVAAYKSSAEICQMESDLMARYQSLSARERAGEVLPSYEVNQYHALRDRLQRHPLFMRREASQHSLKEAFVQTAGTLSSLLTVDFTAFVK